MNSNIIELGSKELPGECYVYKHSTQCGQSARAAEVIQTFTFPKPVYWINVIESRDISNWVEATYQVRHESPQLIKIQGGKALKVWNHKQIKAENII